MSLLSTSLFSALLAGTSPISENIRNNDVFLPMHEVRNTVERCLSLWKSMDVDILHRNLYKNLQDAELFPLMEEILWVFPGSKQELFTIATSVGEQTTQELQQQAQTNKGYIQMSKEHWQKLLETAQNKEKPMKDRLIALLQLIWIINFFTLLAGTYSLTVRQAKKWENVPSILFAGFTISNGLGVTALFLAWMPLEWAGYWIATIGAIASFFFIRRNEKTNLHDKAFMEHMEQYTAFSIYDIDGRGQEFSPKLLNMLGTTKEEVFAYQEKHGEITTLFYPDTEERERIAAYQSELKENGQAYEATFFPRRVDNKKKLALHFNTIPRMDKKGKVIGQYRFAEDVTRDHRDNIDLLTGAFDKMGFEKKFSDILAKKKTRWADQIQTWSLSIIYSDLDSFKSINDTYNHDNADVILKEFIKMARRHFRDDDTIARFWGDEFGIICDNSDKEVILLKFNNLRDEFSRSTFEIISGCLIENGLIVHDSYEEALIYRDKRNSEIQKDMEQQGKIYDRFIHCCIGGVWVTGGVTDFSYGTSFSDEQNALQILVTLKNQAEKVMNLIKYLEFLGIEGMNMSKNGVGMPILDDKQGIIGAEIHNRAGQVNINRETLAKAPELIIEGVKKATKHR